MSQENSTVRVFIALDLPAATKFPLSRAIAELQRAIPSGVRWVDPAGIHLTLKFLGDIEAGRIEPVLDAMGQGAGEFGAAALSLRLSGLGVFPNLREPRVLWAGVKGDLAALGRLQQGVDESCAALGFARERRPFRPHLTLGRVRDSAPATTRRDVGEAVAALSAAPKPEPEAVEPGADWPATEIHLIRSNLTPHGAIYTSLGAAPLA